FRNVSGDDPQLRCRRRTLGSILTLTRTRRLIMDRPLPANLFRPVAALILVTVAFSTGLHAQSTATIRGTVTDASGAVVVGATVVLHNQETDLERSMATNSSGSYEISAGPIGTYQLQVRAKGMRSEVLTGLLLHVSQIVVQNVQLEVAQTSEVITVSSEAPVIDAGTMTVGGVINQRTVQEIPLNGRHFVDLGLLVAGTVTPPQ